MNPYLIIGIIIAWLASLAGVGYWQNEAGHVAERTTWQTRENVELRAANDKILALEAEARAEEAAHAQRLADIAERNLKEKQRATKQHEADLAALRAGTLVLRDPGATGIQACAGAAGSPGPGADGGDGAAAGRLSDAASEFLLSEADRADEVARQLADAQAVILEDRRVCGPP